MMHSASTPSQLAIPGQPRVSSMPDSDDVFRTTLSNGIIVLARENWSAPSVAMRGYVHAGNLDEPADLCGLSSFTATMLTRGTARRSFADISDTVESASASMGFWSEAHITRFATKSLAEDLDLILDVLSDELQHSTFPAEYVERVRGQRLTAIRERENDTGAMAGLAYLEMMYENHPFGRDSLGTPESNAAVTRAALEQFHATNFAPEGMVIAVVGAVSVEDAARRVEAALGNWDARRPVRPPIPPLPPLDGVRSKHVRVPDKSQSDILMGWRAMRRTDPDYECARLANTILGVFGMMGRLGESVREEQGMAYYAYSSLAGGKEAGSWVTSAGVAPDNVERASSSILAEVERLCDERVSEDELEDSKRFLIGSLPLQMETNEGVASLLADVEWHGLGLDYLERYTAALERLTPAEVQEVAARYLQPNAYVRAVAGP